MLGIARSEAPVLGGLSTGDVPSLRWNPKSSEGWDARACCVLLCFLTLPPTILEVDNPLFVEEKGVFQGLLEHSLFFYKQGIVHFHVCFRECISFCTPVEFWFASSEYSRPLTMDRITATEGYNMV